jgi:hypothetical protein
MKQLIFSTVIGTIALAVGIGVPSGEAAAQAAPGVAPAPSVKVLACYKWDIFPEERFKLDILFHSKLSEREEQDRFGHPAQDVFSVHGKHVGVCGKKTQPDQFKAISTVRPVVGTLISVEPLGTPGGARLGLETFATTGLVGAAAGTITRNWCKDVEISCKALDNGFPPKRWLCFSQNKFPVEHRQSFLTLVNEANDPLCSQFEDGVFPQGRPDTNCFVPPFDPTPPQGSVAPASGCTTQP